MIEKPNTARLLSDLQIPLRDALRGAAMLADATEEIFDPATRQLPEPLRSKLRHAIESLEEAGKRLTQSPIDIDQIQEAARFLTGAKPYKQSSKTCARMFAYAWDHLNGIGVARHYLLSETILAGTMARIRARSRATGVDFAADVLANLRASAAVAPIPGLGRATDHERLEADIALLATAVWLLATRSTQLDEEERVLDLSVTLVKAMKDDATAALAGHASLVRFLLETSAHL